MQPPQYAIMREVEDQHWWYVALRSMVARDVVSLTGCKTGGSILDAGCGTGGMLHWLREAGGPWELSGLDIEPVAVAHSQERGFENVRVGSVNDVPFPDGSQDLVTCLDVLYHSGVEPEGALRELWRVLKPGGHLLLNLAAFDILRGSHDDAVHGARRFTPGRVRQMLADADFEIVNLQCWNAWLFPTLLLMRLFSRVAGARPDGDLREMDRGLNALLTGIARADTVATRFLQCPIGTSVYAIARKSAE